MSFINTAETILQTADLHLDHQNVDIRGKEKTYRYYPIIREDGTAVGVLVIEDYDQSVSVDIYPNSTERERAAMDLVKATFDETDQPM
ncbi:hypothetical protein PCCS19_36200 [Paenibacillus sp. CCS19]|uniref:hypothetical protein n=1 Tax=Paenibacillus sp. CCS19 TaxID=3158387 RepID=UPI002567C141|nr:hypothetical protein [Paenibacillus cellulosilyticus]GMK40564.1 hypothetical protein PCCS19_36200 [Paenibacillus cellulosilyticus]